MHGEGAGASASPASLGVAAVGVAAAAAWALRKPKAAAAAEGQGVVSSDDDDAPPLESASFSTLADSVRERHAAAAADESADEANAAEGSEAADNGTADDAACDGQSTSKLWTADQFPEGITGAWNWDLENLKAAQEWECPCLDRRNCIGSERISVLELYDYRKNWRLSVAPNEGGQRDCARKELDGHKDGETKTFTRSFVVGKLADCCAPSAGLAKGMSWANWAESRADSRLKRPFRAGRAIAKDEAESSQRAHLRAWIMDHRDGFEGPKGGSDPVQKWRTDYMPQRKRWDAYCESRAKEGLPIIGCQTIFVEEWKNASIQEEKACGHAKCNVCGHLDALEIQFAGRADKLKEVAEKKVLASPV